ncbi:DNA mismatch repair protein [Martensiomyces pterosporus]|nr:DNA mismatch repair protein [Martensiomyces pterosporus]
MSKNDERPDLNLDKTTEQGFCKFFASLPTQENTIHVFERSNGDYYSVHGADAEYVASVVYKTTTVIKYLGNSASNGGLASCTMSRIVAENFLRDCLLSFQLRVEIYSPHDSKQSNWRVSRTASPGNLQEVEEMLFSTSEIATAPMVMSVVLKNTANQMQLGVAFIDPAQRAIGVCEFIDNDVLSNLESLVIQLSIKECLVEQDTSGRQLEHSKLVGVLERCGVVVTECKRAQFSDSNIVQDLGRLLGSEVPVASLPETDRKLAMKALASVIQYLNLLMVDMGANHYTIYTHNLAQYMKLDASAVQALNLVPAPQDGASKTMSLQGLLNRCKTSQGQRLLEQWLKQPLLSVEEIEDRLSLVELFFNDSDMREILRAAHLRNMPDFKRLANRFNRGSATLQDIVRCYQVVIALPGLCDALAAGDSGSEQQQLIEKYYLQDLLAVVESLKDFRSLVEISVDLAMADSHEFMLRTDFDQDLEEIRGSMDREMRCIIEEQAHVSEALDLEANKKLKLEKHSTFGHCLKVSRTDGARLRGKSTRYIELSTLKTGVYFTTPALRDSSRAYKDLSGKYDQAQAKLVSEVIKVAASYCPVFEKLNKSVAHLDVILSFAEASATAPIPYTRPTVSPSGDVRLVAARHPCLEVQDGVSFIANDVAMAQGESEFVIITGPNMGGKSTYIRQIGVIALMAQIGCFVPCESAELCIFDCILARVGAGDAQLKGVSTFMAEMLETASILKTATDRSLVIIDELGRGTSTYDGFGLAWAISEHLIKEIRCKCLFATHFHELTELEAIYASVDNRHVMARITANTNAKGAAVGQRDLTLLYRIGKGVCDQSFGIHVAELANFPESIVRLAKRKVSELEDFSSVRGKQEAGSDDSAAKQQRQFAKEEMADGSRMIERFLREFNDTPGLAEMPSKAVAQRVDELKAKYSHEIASNAWVQHVIDDL